MHRGDITIPHLPNDVLLQNVKYKQCANCHEKAVPAETLNLLPKRNPKRFRAGDNTFGDETPKDEK